MRIIKKKLYYLVFINIIFGITLTLFVNDYKGSFLQNIWSFLVLLVLILLPFIDKKNIFNPGALFSISIVVFIWSRLILKIFAPMVVVLAGDRITDYNVLKSSLITGILINIIILSFLLSEKFIKKYMYKFSFEQRNSFPKIISIILLSVSILSGLYFLIVCFQKINIIHMANYTEIAGSSALTSGVKYFRVSKYLITFWILFGKEKDRFYYGSLLLFVFSIGFLFIGLRGYTIAYFFLFLFFRNIQKKISLFKLIIIAFGLLFLANFILEYRLGYSVANGFFDIIIKTFFNQGASFEVVFGAVIFKKEIINKFPYFNYFFKKDYLGDIIDLVRGVNYLSGGFGTSYFAELYYLGFFPMLILAFFTGVILRVLQNLNYLIYKLKEKAVYPKIVLFLTIPNLVYFARSDAFDLIKKVSFVLIIIFVIKKIRIFKY